MVNLPDPSSKLADRAGGLDRLPARTRPAQPPFDHMRGARKFLVDRSKLIARCSATLSGPRSGCSTASPRESIASIMSDTAGSSSYSTSISADGVLGDVAGVRHDQHDRLADMADLAERDATLLDRRIGEARQRPGFLGRVLPGDHGDDARQRLRRALSID